VVLEYCFELPAASGSASLWSYMTGTMPNIVGIPMCFLLGKGYALCVIADLCVMLCNSPPTNVVDTKRYVL
jgi:hypothetical protein